MEKSTSDPKLDEMRRQQEQADALYNERVQKFMRTYNPIKYVKHHIRCVFFGEYTIPVCPDNNCPEKEKCTKFLFHSRILELNDSIKRYRKAVQSLQRDNDELVARLDGEFEQQEKKIRELGREGDRRYENFRTAETQLRNKETENTNLRLELNTQKTENEKLETRIEELTLKINTLQQQIKQQKATPRRDKPKTTKVATSVRQRVISYLETCEESQILNEIALALDLELNKTSEILEQLEADGEVTVTEGEGGIFEYSI